MVKGWRWMRQQNTTTAGLVSVFFQPSLLNEVFLLSTYKHGGSKKIRTQHSTLAARAILYCSDTSVAGKLLFFVAMVVDFLLINHTIWMGGEAKKIHCI